MTTQVEDHLASAMSGDRANACGEAGLLRQERFAELYVRMAPHLFRYFWIHTRSILQAEDLVSATFLDALRSLPAYDLERGSVRRWLIGIAKRELGRYRQCTVRRAPVRRTQMPAAGSEEPGPSDASEERIDLWRAVAELSNVEREILAMKFGAGLGNNEIAEATGLRYIHVGVVLHRALQKLRQRMKCEVDGDGQE